MSSICLLNATMQKQIRFNCITYSILQIIFIEFFHIHQDLIQRPEMTNLDEDELTFVLENFSLMMDVLDSDLNVGWAEVRNSAIVKRSLGLIWMDLFRMKDNFEFLIEDIDKVTPVILNSNHSFLVKDMMTILKKIIFLLWLKRFFEYLEECNPLT